MKRPETDDYYWYRPKDGKSEDWQPVFVKGEQVWLIGDEEPHPANGMDGSFVRMGRPIPFIGTIGGDGKITPPDEESFGLSQYLSG